MASDTVSSIIAASLGAYHGQPVDLPPQAAEVELKEPEPSPRRRVPRITISQPVASAPMLRRTSTESDKMKERRMSTHLDRPVHSRSPSPEHSEAVPAPIPALASAELSSPNLTLASSMRLTVPRVVDYDAVSTQILEFAEELGKRKQLAESEGLLVNDLVAQVNGGRIRLEDFAGKQNTIRFLRGALDRLFRNLHWLSDEYGLMHAEDVRDIYYSQIQFLDIKRSQLDGSVREFEVLLKAHLALKETFSKLEEIAKKVDAFFKGSSQLQRNDLEEELKELALDISLIPPMQFADRQSEGFCHKHWEKKTEMLAQVAVLQSKFPKPSRAAEFQAASDEMGAKLQEMQLKRLSKKPNEEEQKTAAEVQRVKEAEAVRKAKEKEDAECLAKSEAQARERMAQQKKIREQEEAAQREQVAKEKREAAQKVQEAQRAREAAAAAAAEAEMARRAKELEAERAQRAKEAEERKKHFAQVTVTCNLDKGHTLGIRGELNWNESVRFTLAGSDWKGEIPLGKSFKFVSIPSQGEVKWEGGENRSIKDGGHAQAEINAKPIKF